MSDISIAGITAIGGGEANISDPPCTWSLEQKVAIQYRRHSLKFGAQFYDRNRGGSDLQGPGVTYSSIADLLPNIPSSITVTFGHRAYVAKSKMFGVFAQDNWRLNPKLVLNLGVRYDYMEHLYDSATLLATKVRDQKDGELSRCTAAYDGGTGWTGESRSETAQRGSPKRTVSKLCQNLTA